MPPVLLRLLLELWLCGLSWARPLHIARAFLWHLGVLITELGWAYSTSATQRFVHARPWPPSSPHLLIRTITSVGSRRPKEVLLLRLSGLVAHAP